MDNIGEEEEEDCFDTPYALDIYENHKKNEPRYQPFDYMELQIEINSDLRASIVDYVIYICEEYQLVSDVTYLTVNYFDRYASKKLVRKENLVLLTMACLAIAEKIDEMKKYKLSILDISNITYSTYSVSQIFQMEGFVCNVLKFDLLAPTVKVFLRIFLQVVKKDDKLLMLSNYLCELSLYEYSLLKYLPSTIAVSSIYLGLYILDRPPKNDALKRFSGYDFDGSSTVQECVAILYQLFCNAHERKYSEVRKKYSQGGYLKVALMKVPCTPLVKRE